AGDEPVRYPLRGSIRSTVRVNLNLALNTEILTLPEMATHPLNFCRREGKGKTRFAQTVSLPFSSLQQKFKAPSRARYGHTIEAQPQ
ncbi:hypothetical protein, partial [Ralstonia pickettii]|uniref:hypothetical protein n=2 Tax=Ralstonia pickettii TaxID=329 RepID=UPI00292F31D8